MATLKPFAALRPKPELADQICELPYDVMSSEEARQMAAGNPLSFLHVSKPEIDLPPGTDLYANAVYAQGKANFTKLISQGALQPDAQPGFYLYRQIMGNHAQIGLVAAASCEEYLNGVIKKHEFTRPDKEDDRVRHIEALHSQTGPVFLTYRAVAALDEFIAKRVAAKPDVDFTGKDGVRHSSWTVGDAEGIKFIADQFATIPFLYIADGHHRSAAAARVYLKRSETPHPASGHPLHEPGGCDALVALPGVPGCNARPFLEVAAPHEPERPLTPSLSPSEGERVVARPGAGHAAQFLTVIFPHNQVQILPYNRVLKDLNGLTAAQLLQKLDGIFVIQPKGAAQPARKHELGLFLDGQWHTLTFRPPFAATSDPIEQLDVTLLQKFVLAPIFGITDPRTSKRINFVGGIRGTAELEKLVTRGEYACAFSLFPTSIEDLMTIADAGGIMPPKSTWFEPKLRDAMFCHMI